jgi:transposase
MCPVPGLMEALGCPGSRGVAALDIGKAEVVCCVRVPDEYRSGRRGGRGQHVRTFPTVTRSLTELSDWLTGFRVTRTS